MQRSDNRYEVLRRHNIVGRSRANMAIMAGLSDEAFDALAKSLGRRRSFRSDLPIPSILRPTCSIIKIWAVRSSTASPPNSRKRRAPAPWRWTSAWH
jgi:D-alanyl-D-alanine dipeptidase